MVLRLVEEHSAELGSSAENTKLNRRIRCSSWMYIKGSPGYVKHIKQQQRADSRLMDSRPTVPSMSNPRDTPSQSFASTLPRDTTASSIPLPPPHTAPTEANTTFNSTGSWSLLDRERPKSRPATWKHRTWSNDANERSEGWQYVYLTGYTQSVTRPFTRLVGEELRAKTLGNPARPPGWPRITGAWIDGPQFGGRYSPPFLSTQSVGSNLDPPMWGWEAHQVEKLMTERRNSAPDNPKLKPKRNRKKRTTAAPEGGDGEFSRYQEAMLKRYVFTKPDDCQRHRRHAETFAAEMQGPTSPHRCTVLCKRSCAKRPPLPSIQARNGPSKVVRNKADRLLSRGGIDFAEDVNPAHSRGSQTGEPASRNPTAVQKNKPKKSKKPEKLPTLDLGLDISDLGPVDPGSNLESMTSLLKPDGPLANLTDVDEPPAASTDVETAPLVKPDGPLANLTLDEAPAASTDDVTATRAAADDVVGVSVGEAAGEVVVGEDVEAADNPEGAAAPEELF